jgi:GNAT superfamily N-acetyltransferase
VRSHARDLRPGVIAAAPRPAARVERTEAAALDESDLAEVHAIRVRAADFFHEVDEPTPTPASFQADLDDLPEGYTRADEAIYRAYRDGRPVGYAEVLRDYAAPDQWMIGIVLVDAEERSRGVGREIVAAIAADARSAGARSLAAGVIATRERSLAFWRREGFTTEVRRRPITIGGVQTDVVRLERAL